MESGRPYRAVLGFAPGLVTCKCILQIEGHFHPTLVALRRIFCQGTRKNVIESRGQIQIEGCGGHRFVIDHLEGNGDRTIPLKWPVTSEKHVEDHAERKKIGAAIDRLPVHLLRRHE